MPKRNREYDVYRFRQAKQNQGENIMTYCTRLRKQAEYCEFPNLNGEIKSQIIQSCLSSRLRRRALRDSDITLDELLTLARGFELSDQQAHVIEHPNGREESVQMIHNRQPPNSFRGKARGRGKQSYRKPCAQQQKEKTRQCYRCGGEFPHQSNCPAKGKMCSLCKKSNHFAKMCKSRQYKDKAYSIEAPVREPSSEEDEYGFHIKGNNSSPKAEIILNKTPMSIIVDTGATVDIIMI
ncbi:PREDICTED: uncharacterized protein LOC106808332 [Priapulus caudatus]|uniref:Uncharacterized protein LOC106808332 n=1 Tax=Priapulus caudatus TaxID=37621 RepID=A0ABM1E2S7_PRICU|nr:PREDICTED: uncharacterized protein LOC106808332 [Priapulus caudatus]